MRYSILLLALASSLASACLYKRADGDAPAPNFSYTGETGPLGWHRIPNTNNTLCATGKNQSPINVIPGENAKLAKQIQLNYPLFDNNIEVYNNGHTILFTPKDAGLKGKYGATLDGKKYKLIQFHFHGPSEHQIRSEVYPLEVHFVHQAEEGGNLAVVGVLFDLNEGFGDSLLLSTTGSLDQVKEDDKRATTDGVNFSSIVQVANISNAFTYSGSLTTPPCTEGISWYVIEQTLSMSVKQFQKWKNIMKYNSRNTQNLPGHENLLEFATDPRSNRTTRR
ncbi:alpha carbonic anhydrase [Peziza echinospora]|nr:alpha carbonic anhydrase [Peziza echinospora]